MRGIAQRDVAEINDPDKTPGLVHQQVIAHEVAVEHNIAGRPVGPVSPQERLDRCQKLRCPARQRSKAGVP